VSTNPPLILGINAAYHESAAALVRGGELLFAVEEERYSRVKHAKPALVDNPDQLPWAAIDACLRAAGAELGEVALVGYAQRPGARLGMIEIDPYPLREENSWGTDAGEREFDRRLRGVPDLLEERTGVAGFADRVRFLGHHEAHAACAYHLGPSEDAALLVIDGVGEMATAWLGQSSHGEIERIEEIPYPHSIGMLWEQVSAYLGMTEYDAGKAMGLSAYGDPERFRDEIDRLFAVPDPSGGEPGSATPPFVIDHALARFRGDSSGFESLFGPRLSAEDVLPDAARFADLSAAIQRRTEEALLATARRLARATGKSHLGYAGGVALNCVANARLEREGPFETLYIPGPAHDAGTAVGAALALAQSEGYSVTPHAQVSPLPLLGPDYTPAEIDAAIADAELRSEEIAEPERLAAELVADGQVVAWFQGRLELGPRALGNRSLLADPRLVDSRERLNLRVKHREPYRPFAASCLAEALSDWFEVPDSHAGAATTRELMLLAYPVRAQHADSIPAVVHHDRTCRIQTVEAAHQPLYHALISRFAELTGVPMVLNTSFNDQEPIICSPEEALRTFARTGIDALFLGDRLVRRRR